MKLFASERAIWTPRERLTVSEWADKYFRLPSNDPKPGAHWRTDFMPFQREILDTFSDPDCEEVCVVAGAQTGKSRKVEIWGGYTVDVLGTDLLHVVPREVDIRTVMRSRLRPMLDTCSALSRQLTSKASDVTMEQLSFVRANWFLGASGTAASLASKTCSVVLLDEVGKFPVTIRREGSPVLLALQRTNQFEGRRKIAKVSTPTTERHGISLEWANTDQREFYVPCPHCGTFQTIEFERIRWPQECDPDVIFLQKLAWFECIACKGRWDHGHKCRQLAFGKWVQGKATIDERGNVSGEYRTATRGYHVPGMLSPLRTWSDFAARFLRAKRRNDLAGFFRSDVGRPWTVKVEQITVEGLEKNVRTTHRIGLIPDGVKVLVAGADIGKYRSHWCIWGVGAGMSLWLIDRGIAAHVDELDRAVLRWEAASGRSIPVRRVGVDVGWDDAVRQPTINQPRVVEFINEHRSVCWAVRGRRRLAGRHLDVRSMDRMPNGQVLRGGWKEATIDTSFFKDLFAERRALRDDDEGAVHLPVDVGRDFLSQLASEAKVEQDDGGEAWEPIGETPNHYLDATIYAIAMAWSLGLWKRRKKLVVPAHERAKEAANVPGDKFAGESPDERRQRLALEQQRRRGIADRRPGLAAARERRDRRVW